MTEWLIRRFVKNCEMTTDQKVRGHYGMLGSIVGILVNAALAGIKFVIGSVTASVAVTADAANNLSDAAGSVVSLLSVRLAQKPIDRDHPYGYGRMEYLGAIGVGLLIVMMGFELLKSSIDSIIHPDSPAFAWIPFTILIISVLMKGWLYFFYRRIAKKIDSATLEAASKDSISDVLATSAVAVSMLIGYFTGWKIDGWMGLIVAALILKAGISVIKETADTLLGGKPDPEIGRSIVSMMMQYDQILGTHDLMVHDYGPGRCAASIHAEVPADGNILELHEMIDRAEQAIACELNIPICIHMDPIVTGDDETNRIKMLIDKFLKSIDPELLMHDFRRVPGQNQINLLFDVVIQAGSKNQDQLKEQIIAYAKEIDPRHHCIIRFDIDYCGK